MSEERREFNRIIRSSKVSFQINIKDELGVINTIKGVTEDISKGGIRVRVEDPVPLGLIAALCIENKNGQLMLLYSECRWCKPVQQGYECGFQILDAEQSDLIHWLKHAE